MNALVIGASGQVGGAIFRKLEALNHPVQGTYHSVKADGLFPLDITKPKQVEEYLSEFAPPSHIFIPGAITNVDFCETNSEETYRTNVLGVKNVADLANPESRIIFFSTDFVFDGEQGLYSELDLPNPISKYGQQKLAAEHYLATHAKKFTIIRTNVVFGPETQGKNFVTRLIQNLQLEKEVTIPKDEFGTPTYGPALASASIELSDNGIFHLSGSKLISRYRFALEVAEVFGLRTNLIKPILSADLKRPAKRPLSAGLVSKYTDLTIMDYRDGLIAMKQEV